MLDIRVFAERLPWAVILIRQEKIEWFNAKALAWFPECVMGMDIAHCLPLSLSTEALSTQESVQISFPDQRVSADVSIVRYLDGSLCLIIQDTTHLHHLERMRQDFVANVSHELRTPLTVIHGYLEMLQQNNSMSDNWFNIIEQMWQQSNRMEKIVEDLLLLSRLEHDEPIQQRFKEIDMEVVLARICRDAEILSGERQHRIELVIQTKHKLLGIEDELTSAFANLIVNAVNYTPAGGNIRVTWQRCAQNLILSVTDTGIGIADQHLPRLTERFYRVDKARSRSSGGTGLGLAIVKHALLRHHAQLKIESQLNHGSVFSCEFPITLAL